jgi:glycosyltransferase involved in cell wall biosynthesis
MNSIAADAQIRVCMLLESFHPVVGGMETQARNMAESFRHAGISVIVLTRRVRADLPTQDSVDETPVIRTGPFGASSRLRWFFAVTCIPALFSLRHRYDIILVPGFRALGIPAVIVGKLLHKKCVLKAESSGEMSGEFFAGGLARIRLKPDSFWVRGALRIRNRWLAQADAFASLSREQTDEFIRCGVPPERIAVIPQSVRTDRFKPASADERARLRQRLGIPQDALIVIYTGRIVSYKGLPLLVQIWLDVLAKFPNARLFAVGGGGVDVFNCEAEIRRRVEQAQLQNSVTLTGAVHNVEDYLQASDLYALPTQNEAFPLALLEAMACALPCVSTPVGGIPDIIRHGENGWLVPAGDADALRDAILQLLGDAALRARLGQAALETARTRYAREKVTEQYIDLFRRLTRPK